MFKVEHGTHRTDCGRRSGQPPPGRRVRRRLRRCATPSRSPTRLRLASRSPIPLGRAAAHQAPDHPAQRARPARHLQPVLPPRPRRRSAPTTSPSCARATGGCGARARQTIERCVADVGDYSLARRSSRRSITGRLNGLWERIEAEPEDRASGRGATASAGPQALVRGARGGGGRRDVSAGARLRQVVACPSTSASDARSAAWVRFRGHERGHPGQVLDRRRRRGAHVRRMGGGRVT